MTAGATSRLRRIGAIVVLAAVKVKTGGTGWKFLSAEPKRSNGWWE